MYKPRDELVDTTNEARAGAGIYLGHPAWGTQAHIFYNYETKAQFERTRVEFNPTFFPLRDLLEAAEHLPEDRAVDVQGVCQYGLLRLDEATDSQLGEYSGHKGLRFYLPESCVPILALQHLVGKV